MADFSIHQIESDILRRKRKLRVWLPGGFRADGPEPPSLLIQQDGQLAFSNRDGELPYGSWRLDRWIERLARRGDIVPPVVVGIDNSPKRMWEYFPGTDHFENYEHFLLRELMPWIERELGITPLPRRTALMGSSMGGLVSFALLFRNPTHFSAAACLSPWFEYEDFHYLRETLHRARKKPDVRVYMDSGIMDWRGLDDGHRGMLMARKELLRLGFSEGEEFDWFVDTHFATEAELEHSHVKPEYWKPARENQHTEYQWTRRLERPLRFLFGREP